MIEAKANEHMNVLIYDCSGCGDLFMWVLSLKRNYRPVVSFVEFGRRWILVTEHYIFIPNLAQT